MEKNQKKIIPAVRYLNIYIYLHININLYIYMIRVWKKNFLGNFLLFEISDELLQETRLG